MAKEFDELRLSPFSKGLMDGPDSQDVPQGGLHRSRGFEFSRRLARSLGGRATSATFPYCSTKYVRAEFRYVKIDGATSFIGVCDGIIWTENTSGSRVYNLPISKIITGGTSGALAAQKVTISGGTPRVYNTVRAGAKDYFYFDAEGPTAATLIATLGTSSVTLASSYGGSDTSGSFTIVRKMLDTAATTIAHAGERLWFADGAGPLHSYGPQTSGGTNHLYREAGLAKPTGRPTLVFTSGGSLTAGTYIYEFTWEDKRGWIGPALSLHEATVSSGDKAMMASFPAAPGWAYRMRIYRTKVDGDQTYHCGKDLLNIGLSAVTTSATSTTLTLHSSAQALTVDAHINRYVFNEAGASYRIIDNTSASIEVSGNAALEGSSHFSIEGGYDIDSIASVGWQDFFPDTGLDIDHKAPGTLFDPIKNEIRSYHQPPPSSGLKYITVFRGGGRLAAYQSGTTTHVWITGRPPDVSNKVGDAAGGEGEFDLWSYYHDAGPQDGDEIQGLIEVGRRFCAVKRGSVWQLDQQGIDVSDWQFFPSRGGKGVGCLAPRSIVVHGKSAFWLGLDSGEVDLIFFDGLYGYGIGRRWDRDTGLPRLRACLDEMKAFAEATGVVFEGVYHLSYAYGTQSPATNRRTLRYDIQREIFDIQPWGCGPFCKPFSRGNSTFLYCCAPGAVSKTYRLYTSQQDRGAAIERVLMTGDFSFPDLEHPVDWSHIILEVKLG